MLGPKFVKFLKSVLKRQVDFSPNFVSLFSFMKDYSCSFLAQTIYTFLKRSPLKWKCFRLSSARVKFFMPILKWGVDSSPNLVSLFSFMKDYSSLRFSPNNIYLAHKEPIKVKIFETFERSGQNLSNSLCQFLNKSIPLQILYPSSVWWKITSLYFCSSNNIYFSQNEHIKLKIFETFKCSGQNSSKSSCQFWNDKSIPLQVLHHSSFSWHITPLWILSWYFFNFGLKDPINIPILRLSIALVKR